MRHLAVRPRRGWSVRRDGWKVLVCLAVVVVLTMVGGFTSSARPVQQLTFSDEFDGPAGAAPDPGKWRHDVGAGWGDGEQQQVYTDGNENTFLDGSGNLVIMTRELADPVPGCADTVCRYSSGRLLTQGIFSQTHGVFEARIKLPTGPVWPAFWLLGDQIDRRGWPASGEIDVMETGKGRGAVRGTVHGPYTVVGEGSPFGHAFSLPGGKRFSDDFHVFSVEWTSDAINWKVDGVQYGSTTKNDIGKKDWVFDHPFFILLNLAVPIDALGRPTNSGDPANQKMVVDYVRAYSFT